MELFILNEGKQVGPFSEEQLRGEIASGVCQDTTLAWHDGIKEWKPIRELLGVSGDNQSNSSSEAVHHLKSDVLDNDPSSVFSMADGGELGIGKTISLFKTLDYGFLLPAKRIFTLELLRKKAVKWVLFFGLAPIVIWVAACEWGLSFQETIWFFESYFCVFWALYLQNLIRPSTGIWKRALGYALFTIIVGVPILLLGYSLPIMRNLLAASSGDSMFGRAIGYILGVGAVEETIKALPLLIFALRKPATLHPKDALFLGFVSGLGFAASEGVLYSFGAAKNAFEASSDFADAAFTLQILQTMFRFMSGTLLHASWAGTTGWFVGVAASSKQHRWPIIVVGIGFMGVLHGINDIWAGSWLHPFIAAASILIFMSYIAFGEPMRTEAVDSKLE